jgi:hypothetical protein
MLRLGPGRVLRKINAATNWGCVHSSATPSRRCRPRRTASEALEGVLTASGRGTRQPPWWSGMPMPARRTFRHRWTGWKLNTRRWGSPPVPLSVRIGPIRPHPWCADECNSRQATQRLADTTSPELHQEKRLAARWTRKPLFCWWPRAELNHRHKDLQADPEDTPQLTATRNHN